MWFIVQYFRVFILGGVLVLVHECFFGVKNETIPKTILSGNIGRLQRRRFKYLGVSYSKALKSIHTLCIFILLFFPSCLSQFAKPVLHTTNR